MGFTNSGGTWEKWAMCLCLSCGGMSGVGESGWAVSSRVWERVVVFRVCGVSLDYLY